MYALNVGGKRFDVAADTLERIPFFEPIVSGRFTGDVDEKGQIFVDRSPDIFAIILQSVRTNSRPSRLVLERYTAELTADADFYCIGWLSDALKGKPSEQHLSVDVVALRAFERSARQFYETGQNEAPSKHMLRDLHKEELHNARPEAMGLPLFFRREAEKPLSIAPFPEFRQRFNEWSGGLVEAIEAIGPGICIAGGSVLAALLGCGAGDIDIFVTDPPRAEDLCRQVFEAVQRNQATRHGTASKILVTRSHNAVTFYRMGSTGEAARPSFPPVQIITSVFQDSLDLLLGFDVDCCCVAWEIEKQRVVATERALRAIRHRTNIADPMFGTTSYCRRLEKYARRGFAVAVPDFDDRLVNESVARASYVHVANIDMLLRVGDIVPRRVCLPKAGAKATSIQGGLVQKGFLRLFVLDRLPYRTLRLESGTHLLSAGCRDRYHIFRGVRRLSTHGDEDDSDITADSSDDEQYRGIPTETIDALLTCAMRKDLREDDVLDEDSWLKGGAMQRLTHYMQLGKMHHVLTVAMEGFCDGVALNKKVGFVYDFAPCTTGWTSLRFVHDAGRRPLRSLADDLFMEAYGITRTLQFGRRPPRHPSDDSWFSDLY